MSGSSHAQALGHAIRQGIPSCQHQHQRNSHRGNGHERQNVEGNDVLGNMGGSVPLENSETPIGQDSIDSEEECFAIAGHPFDADPTASYIRWQEESSLDDLPPVA